LTIFRLLSKEILKYVFSYLEKKEIWSVCIFWRVLLKEKKDSSSSSQNSSKSRRFPYITQAEKDSVLSKLKLLGRSNSVDGITKKGDSNFHPSQSLGATSEDSFKASSSAKQQQQRMASSGLPPAILEHGKSGDIGDDENNDSDSTSGTSIDSSPPKGIDGEDMLIGGKAQQQQQKSQKQKQQINIRNPNAKKVTSNNLSGRMMMMEKGGEKSPFSPKQLSNLIGKSTKSRGEKITEEKDNKDDDINSPTPNESQKEKPTVTTSGKVVITEFELGGEESAKTPKTPKTPIIVGGGGGASFKLKNEQQLNSLMEYLTSGFTKAEKLEHERRRIKRLIKAWNSSYQQEFGKLPSSSERKGHLRDLHEEYHKVNNFFLNLFFSLALLSFPSQY
jgi:hypothetical protein